MNVTSLRAIRIAALAAAALLSACGGGGGGSSSGAGGGGGSGGGGGGGGGGQDPQWGTAVLIEGSTGAVNRPRIAMNASGDAAAAWRQTDGPLWAIRANLYSRASGWGNDETVSGSSDANLAEVGIDASGRVITVWVEDHNGHDSIWFARYTEATGWPGADTVEHVTGAARNPRIAMDASGNAVAVWEQMDSGTNNIRANLFTSGDWQGAETIEAESADAKQPMIAMDESGNAMAVWLVDDGGGSSILEALRANRFTAGGGGSWGVAEPVDPGGPLGAELQIALDAIGGAVAIWMEHSGGAGGYDIHANYYPPGGGWSATAQQIDSDIGSASSPRVALDASGNAVAVWQEEESTGNDSIWANHFIPGGGWGDAERIETGSGDAAEPRIAVNASGHAVAVWQQDDDSGTGTNDIWANRYVPGSGWGDAERIETGSGNAIGPEIAIDDDGNALAIWRQTDGSQYSIWANRLE